MVVHAVTAHHGRLEGSGRARRRTQRAQHEEDMDIYLNDRSDTQAKATLRWHGLTTCTQDDYKRAPQLANGSTDGRRCYLS